MKITIKRWYVAMAIRLPGCAMPACIGFGLPRYEREAREAAIDLAGAL